MHFVQEKTVRCLHWPISQKEDWLPFIRSYHMPYMLELILSCWNQELPICLLLLIPTDLLWSHLHLATLLIRLTCSCLTHRIRHLLSHLPRCARIHLGSPLSSRLKIQYVVEFRWGLVDLGQDLREGAWVILEKSSKLIQLRKVLETWKEARRRLLGWWRVILWNSVEEVVYSPVSIAVGCPESSNALIPGEAHWHEAIDLIFSGLGTWLVAVFLLFLRLDFLFFLGFVRLWLYFFFNFGLGGRFLARRGDTETWFMTTRKSVYLMPSFSSCS